MGVKILQQCAGVMRSVLKIKALPDLASFYSQIILMYSLPSYTELYPIYSK